MAAEITGAPARKLAAIALANKIARTAWATMTSGEAYRRPLAAEAVT